MERLTKWENDVICKADDTIPFDMWEISVIKKLTAYEDAEEAGLLVRLPCKVGDKVYILGYKPCHFDNTHPDSVGCEGCEDACDLMCAVVEGKAPSVEWIILNMTGEHPFAYATREEAEAALAKED